MRAGPAVSAASVIRTGDVLYDALWLKWVWGAGLVLLVAGGQIGLVRRRWGTDTAAGGIAATGAALLAFSLVVPGLVTVLTGTRLNPALVRNAIGGSAADDSHVVVGDQLVDYEVPSGWPPRISAVSTRTAPVAHTVSLTPGAADAELAVRVKEALGGRVAVGSRPAPPSPFVDPDPVFLVHSTVAADGGQVTTYRILVDDSAGTAWVTDR